MLTGYPSLDRPWLKYYTEKAINMPLPQCTVYEMIYKSNQDNLDKTAFFLLMEKVFSLPEVTDMVSRAADQQEGG